MTEIRQWEITHEEDRLDKILTDFLPESSRSQIQRWIKEQNVLVNNSKTKSNYQVMPGDQITVKIPAPTPLNATPQDLPLDILYEDDDLIVVNKMRGMIVHPGAGNPDGTLVNALLFHTKELSKGSDPIRPGVVHRLDRDTSGALVVAKNDQAHRKLAGQLEDRSMKREYLALVHGRVPYESGTINVPLERDHVDRQKFAAQKDGKKAITHFTVEEYYEDYTLVRLQLETGRTHQIRVHLSYIGHPIVSDETYGIKSDKKLGGQLLHAATIGFVHPRSGEWVEFNAPLPEVFKDKLLELAEKNKS